MSKGARFLLFIGVIVLGWLIGKQVHIDLVEFRAFFQRFPIVLSGIIFVSLYVITSTLAWFGPKDFFRITGAVFFGGLTSTVFIWASEMLNSWIMFQLSRALGQEFIQEKFGVKSKHLNQAHGKTHFLWIFAFRTNPLIPFRFLDLAYGLTKINYKKYLQAIWHISFIRILWIQLIIAYIGNVLIDDLPRWQTEAANKMDLMAKVYEHIALPLQEHPYFLKVSGIYFLLILCSTLGAWVFEKVQKKKAVKHV